MTSAGAFVKRHIAGETEGIRPRDIDPEALAELHPPMPVLKAIRAKCLDCSCGSEAEVRKCTPINCPLWPYRMGTNPYRTRTMTDEQRLLLAEARAKRREGKT